MHTRRGREGFPPPSGRAKARRWHVRERVAAFRANPFITVWRERVALPSGRVVPDFYTIELPEYAVVVVRGAQGSYLVARQYKHGVGKVTLGFPAGFVGPNESPLKAAKRELLEETGLAAKRWKRLGQFVVDGNRGSGRAHLFLASDARRRADPVPDDTEQMSLQFLPEAKVRAHVKSGRVPVAAHALAFWLASQEVP